MNNELWKFQTGFLCGYTEDRDLIGRIKRYKQDWILVAHYFEKGQLAGAQFKIPIEQRRSAERMFYPAANKQGKQAL